MDVRLGEEEKVKEVNFLRQHVHFFKLALSSVVAHKAPNLHIHRDRVPIDCVCEIYNDQFSYA